MHASKGVTYLQFQCRIAKLFQIVDQIVGQRKRKKLFTVLRRCCAQWLIKSCVHQFRSFLNSRIITHSILNIRCKIRKMDDQRIKKKICFCTMKLIFYNIIKFMQPIFWGLFLFCFRFFLFFVFLFLNLRSLSFFDLRVSDVRNFSAVFGFSLQKLPSSVSRRYCNG